jgi:hypothetical protein
MIPGYMSSDFYAAKNHKMPVTLWPREKIRTDLDSLVFQKNFDEYSNQI